MFDKLKKALGVDEEEEDYEVVSQVPWWWNGGTFTRGAYTSGCCFRQQAQ